LTPEPLRLWSVTTLLKLGLGTSESLVNWAVATTAEAAVDKQRVVRELIESDGRDGAVDWLKRQRYAKSGKAKLRGTDLHTAVEQMVLGEPVTADLSILPYVEQFRAWANAHGPRFLMAEAPVYNPTWRYAGTLDGIVELGGRRFIYDVKTTDKGPDSGKMRPPYPEVALQLCAYARATEVGVLSEQRYAGGKRYYIYDPTAVHEPMPEVDGALCIVVSPFDCFAVPVRIDDGVWQTFLSVIDCARWTLRGSNDLFGPPLREAVAA